MSKHNYTQYSNKKHDGKTDSRNNGEKQANGKPIKPAEKPVAKPTPDNPKPTQAKPEVKLVTETVETVTLPETVEGVVVDCAKLNVRAEPSTDAEIVCVLDVMSEIEIDVNKSSNTWFKICTATGIEGYCMRKFVDAHF